MRTRLSIPLALALFGGLATAVLAADAALDAEAVAAVTPHSVNMQGDAVSGVLESTSRYTVSAVRLQITYGWLWDDERHPGSGNPGRTDYYTVMGEIPPGGSLPFTYQPASPLSRRPGGHFVPSVSVVSLTEVGNPR